MEMKAASRYRARRERLSNGKYAPGDKYVVVDLEHGQREVITIPMPKKKALEIVKNLNSVWP